MRLQRKKVVVILGMVLALSWAVAGFTAAADPDAETSYTANRKLGRGLANLTFGWLDVLKGIQDVTQDHNFFAGITWGTVSGAGKAIVRTGAGVYEVVTFPFPGTQHYAPIVKPEFVLGDNAA